MSGESDQSCVGIEAKNLFVKDMNSMGNSTEPMDVEAATEAIEYLYRAIGLGTPQIVQAASLPQLYLLNEKMKPRGANLDGILPLIGELDDHYRIHRLGWVPTVSAIYIRMLRRHNQKWMGDRSVKTVNEVCELSIYGGTCYWEETLQGIPLRGKSHYWKLLRSVGAMTMATDAVIVADRPAVLKMDNENRLHAEDGPAVEFRDGYKLYVWRGTEVPAEWIEDRENLPVETALTWQNMEQRRAAAEIIGWHNVLEQIPSRTIDRDVDPEIGELIEARIDGWRRNFLRVRCGTGRTFALPVPPEVRTALEAQAWTWGLSVEDFVVPEVRT